MNRLKNLLKAPQVSDDTGAAGYILAWFLGVPASVLFIIFLLRGCN